MLDAQEVAAMLYSATSTAKPGPIPTVIRTFHLTPTPPPPSPLSNTPKKYLMY